MITFDIGSFPMHSNAVSRELQAPVAGDATAAEIRPPDRGVASDPVRDWLLDGAQWRAVAHSGWSVELPDLEWTPKHEKSFATLAGREALGKLSPAEEQELKRLVRLRRQLKNPRSGEELLREYEQRQLTRDVIKALDRYVKFHKAAGIEEQTKG